MLQHPGYKQETRRNWPNPTSRAIQQLNLHLQRWQVSATNKYLLRSPEGYPEWFDAMAHLHLQVFLYVALCSLYSEMWKNLIGTVFLYCCCCWVPQYYKKNISRYAQTMLSQIE